MLIIAPVTVNSSRAESPVEPILEFDQAEGLHFMDYINVSGSSTVPLNSIEISLWNVTGEGQYDLLNSSSSLLSVTPFESELGSTYWIWTHEFNHEQESCTCLLRISLLEQTDLKSYGLTIYLGQFNHRPVLMFSSESYQTSQIMLTTEDVELKYGVLLPPNLVSLNGISNQDVLTTLAVCPAPFGICTDNYSPVTILHELTDGELIVTLETLSINLPDGLYLIDFYVQTMSLRESNTLSQYLAVDRNPPNVTLSSISEILESETITVDLNVDDGYEGSMYSTTWTIIEPNGELRAVSTTEILDDNRLSFTADKQGVYQIFGLIRDTGGNFVNVHHNVSVLNVEPQLDLRYDGFKISNNQTIQNNLVSIPEALEKIADFEIQTTTLETESTKLQTEVGTLNNQINELTAQLEDTSLTETEITATQTEISNLNEQLEATSIAINNTQDEIANVESKKSAKKYCFFIY